MEVRKKLIWLRFLFIANILYQKVSHSYKNIPIRIFLLQLCENKNCWKIISLIFLANLKFDVFHKYLKFHNKYWKDKLFYGYLSISEQ